MDIYFKATILPFTANIFTFNKKRCKFTCYLDLQNDLKHLMKQIEEGLHKVHAQAREQKREDSTPAIAATIGEEGLNA